MNELGMRVIKSREKAVHFANNVTKHLQKTFSVCTQFLTIIITFSVIMQKWTSLENLKV